MRPQIQKPRGQPELGFPETGAFGHVILWTGMMRVHQDG